MSLKTSISSRIVTCLIVGALSLVVFFSPQGPYTSSVGLFGLKSALAEEGPAAPPATTSTCIGITDAAAKIRCQLEAAKNVAGLPGAGSTRNASVATQQGIINAVIGNLLNPLLGFLGAIFLLLTIYAGFLWMTAQGNEEKTKKATDIVKWAVIGLVAVAGSYVLVNFVLGLIQAGVPQT